MIGTIVKHELQFWVKQYSVYIYAGFLFCMGLMAMVIGGDILNEKTPNPNGEFFVNSSLYMFKKIFGQLNILIFFVIPLIYGNAIHRDFKSNMYMVLYSYPVRKLDYVLGKYISASIVAIIVVGSLGLGAVVGEQIPGLDPGYMGPFRIINYLNIYAIYVIPNILLFGGIVFSIVAVSRNVYAGLISVLFLIVIRVILMGVLEHPDNIDVLAIIDPYGKITGGYYSSDWTLEQMNHDLLPFQGVVIWNRLLYLCLSAATALWAYNRYNLAHHATISSIKLFKKKLVAPSETSVVVSERPVHITYRYGVLHELKSTWRLSIMYVSSTVKSKMFIGLFIFIVLLLVMILGQVNPELVSSRRPFTQIMLQVPIMFYSFLITLLTFVYSGYFVHKASSSRMSPLIDATPISSWVFIGSKLMAMVKIQIILLSGILLVGVSIQTYKGFYNYDIFQYLYSLYVIHLATLVIWACLAFFIHSMIPNLYLGIFTLVICWFGVLTLPDLGIKEMVLRFNVAPELSHSDMIGYGASLKPYLIYKGYWLLFGAILMCLTYLVWLRGALFSIKERCRVLIQRCNPKFVSGFATLLLAFFTLGSWIYISEHKDDKKMSVEELSQYKLENEKWISTFANLNFPSLRSMKIEFDIFPKEQSYAAGGDLLYQNPHNNPLDTLWINHAGYHDLKYFLDRDYKVITTDSILGFTIVRLDDPILPKDSIQFQFEVVSAPNSTFTKNSQIESNGTFIMPDFPGIGLVDFREKNKKKREDFGFDQINQDILYPEDSIGTLKSYVQADFLNYEATVSTTEGQIAITNGALKNDWRVGERHYFKYVNQDKIRNGFIFHSGVYDIRDTMHNDVRLQVLHHPSHTHNIESLMRSMKSTIEYCETNFAPYQFDDMKIIEFPRTYGAFAQSFARTISYSEQAGFMTDVDDSNEAYWNSPFRLTAHEMSHQWWGHQVVPADVLGSKFVTEGLAEYTAAMILGHYEGEHRLYNYIEANRRRYFNSRSRRRVESSLKYVKPSEGYVAYQKGLMALYGLTGFVGEEVLNDGLSRFIRKYRFQGPPYPTSLDMIEEIRNVVPDSLEYLVSDMISSVVYYDNTIVDASATSTDSGYQVDIELTLGKYENADYNIRNCTDEAGKTLLEIISGDTIRSLPLSDYIHVTLLGADNGMGSDNVLKEVLYRFDQISNKITMTSEELPSEVVIDRKLYLLDPDIDDNRITVKLIR